MGVKVDLTGRRFGKRLVIGLAGLTKGRRSCWNVKCDCGNAFICLAQDLRRSGPCRKCSPGLKAPRPYRRKRPYEYRYNATLNRARHPMLLTYEEFVEFTAIKNCYYCDAPINWGEPFGKNRPTGTNLDRKDNALPYTKGNVVVACRRCNYGKNAFFTHEEWKQIGDVIRSWSTQ